MQGRGPAEDVVCVCCIPVDEPDAVSRRGLNRAWALECFIISTHGSRCHHSLTSQPRRSFRAEGVGGTGKCKPKVRLEIGGRQKRDLTSPHHKQKPAVIIF